MIEVLLFLLPPYTANALPVFLKGKTPIDQRKKWIDGKRVLGDSKTTEGFIGGVAGGTLVGIVIATFFPLPFYESTYAQIGGAFMLSLGTLVGDALGSFLKRRLGKKEGSPFLLDTFLFMVTALIFAFPFIHPSLYNPTTLLFIFSLTIIIHPLSNVIAKLWGLKRVPW